mgnify:CR=1 FL=1
MCSNSSAQKLTAYFHAGDIWSENGISLLAIMGYWIDSNFTMNEKVLICEPFSSHDHTGDNIKEVTLQGLVLAGVADNIHDVWEHVHACTPDEGANILRAWEIIEGAGYICLRAVHCQKYALKGDTVSLIVKKVKGICAHFHRSVKVSCFNVLSFYQDRMLMNLSHEMLIELLDNHLIISCA